MRRLLAVLAGLSAAAPALADSDVEHARYSVVASAGPIEIRDYAPQIVAETTVAGERDAAINEGFRRLAGYIFGDNAPKQKIAMTAPVEQEKGARIEGAKISMTAPVGQTREGDQWKVRFTMPAEHTLDTLPHPKNPAVKLSHTPGKRMAAIRFSGVAGDNDLAEHEAKLVAHLKAQGLSPKGEAHYAFYDPPWTLPWNRRNEVMVEIPRK
ncbi:MAG: SOUL heme-binding protein [Methylocystis sp.]|nr:MAG: SOUL heme-binding protein [Methylocystis sp.]